MLFLKKGHVIKSMWLKHNGKWTGIRCTEGIMILINEQIFEMNKIFLKDIFKI